MKKPDVATIGKMLDGIYELALNGLPGQSTVDEVAAEYLATPGTLHEQTRRYVGWQILKCSGSGFVTGLGGLLTLPVAIPADLAANWYVQMRMVAVIAVMHGHNVREDRVRTLVYLSLIGDAVNEVLREVGIQLGMRLGEQLIGKISGQTIRAINKAVGTRLVTKFGEKGLINLGKAVPFLGALVGAGFDGFACWAIAKAAMSVFGADGGGGPNAVNADAGPPGGDGHGPDAAAVARVAIISQ